MSTIISLLLISITIPLIFKQDEPITENNDIIIFKFNKEFKNLMLMCTVFCIIGSLGFFLLALFITKQNNEFMISLIFTIIALLCSFLYLKIRNTKIIYENNLLHSFTTFGKHKTYQIQDITDAIEKPTDCMKLTFKNKAKLKIDMQMTNYIKIKDILEKNNIIYTDTNGNNNPRGW